MFESNGETLVGILHCPPAPADIALVIVVGGPQYRAGSHRQFVLLARRISAAGFCVMRFDYRGMGDSTGAPRSFEHVSDDIGAAIDTLQCRVPSVRRIALWGLCDGASAALLYGDDTGDSRVSGVCALNPWVRTEATLAATQLKHYYTQRLASPAFWFKLLAGKVSFQALRELAQKVRLATALSKPTPLGTPPSSSSSSFQQRMARGWRHFSGRILLILSGNDYTAKEFVEHAAADNTWRKLLAKHKEHHHTLAEADHTFSDQASHAAVERLTIGWLRNLEPVGGG